MKFELTTESEQNAFGMRLAVALRAPCVVYLLGDLGAGKTTLTRGVLRGLGFSGAVRSPTYTLLESYRTDSMRVHHLDLYRLSDPEELEFLGLRDLLAEYALWFVEWPERGAGFLPPADLTIDIAHLSAGRRLALQAATVNGAASLDRLVISD